MFYFSLMSNHLLKIPFLNTFLWTKILWQNKSIEFEENRQKLCAIPFQRIFVLYFLQKGDFSVNNNVANPVT